MRRIQDLAIAQKIHLLVTLALLGIAAVGGAGLWSTSRLASASDDVGRTQLPAVRNMTLCDMMHDGMLACVYRALLVSIEHNPDAMAAAIAETDDFAANFRRYVTALDQLELRAETRAAIDAAKPDIEKYIAGALDLVAACARGEREDALAMMADVQAVYDRLETSLGALGERIEADADRSVGESLALASNAKHTSVAMVILGSLAAFVLGTRIAKGIVQPLNAAVKVLESGDMTALGTVHSNDEIGRMAKAVVATVARMEQNARELAAQKATVEQASQAMQQSARDAEENAQRAEQLAAEAARVAAMVEHSPGCMMYADDAMVVRYLNPAAARELERLGGDWSATSLLDQPLDRFYRHPKGAVAFFSVDSNLPFRTQTAIHKDAVELIASPIHDQNGRRIGTLIAWEIITERIDAQRRAALAAAEAARVASMVENAPSCMMYADADMVLRYVNPAATERLPRLGLSAERLVGASLDTFFRHPRGNADMFSDAARLPWSDDVAFGDELVRLSVSAIQDQNGDMIGLMLSWDLITEQRASERRARELQEREVLQAQEIRSKVERMLVAVDAASNGDLTTRIDVEGDDAIGKMAAALTRFLADLRVSMSRIRENAEKLNLASESLMGVGRAMSSEANQTTSQVRVVADAASKATHSMRTVSDSTQGLAQSIVEIATSASSAAKVARTAVESAESTNATVAELDQSSGEIGKILKTITAIAQQTNLLALNATIEAARAGEAGRGFAVVANEVKELAKETAKATTDISAKVGAIQTGSRGAVEAISRISGIIREIDGLQTTIAAAVEQQTAATRDITQNLSYATDSSAAITSNMEQVASAAKITSTGAANSLEVAGDVSRRAAELLSAVARFRC